jgi:hypothetical protein
MAGAVWPQPGPADGGEAAYDLGPGFGTDQRGQLLGGVVRLDVPGGLLPGKRQHRPPASPQEVISREPYNASLGAVAVGGELFVFQLTAPRPTRLQDRTWGRLAVSVRCTALNVARLKSVTAPRARVR